MVGAPLVGARSRDPLVTDRHWPLWPPVVMAGSERARPFAYPRAAGAKPSSLRESSPMKPLLLVPLMCATVLSTAALAADPTLSIGPPRYARGWMHVRTGITFAD